MDFCAGYISGAIGIVVGNPLDILKVKIQSSASGASTAASAPAASTRGNALFKGVAAPILGYGALNALLFTAYNRSLPLVAQPLSAHAQANSLNTAIQQSYPLYAHFVSGILAGLATFVVSTPTELIKCRAQLAASTPATTSAQIARAIFRQHGLAGFYHGGIVTALRDGIGYGFYFLAYEASKDLWAAHLSSGHAWDEQAKIVMCGGFAGVVTWASVFPLDVIKSRVQTHASFLAVDRPAAVVASTSTTGGSSGETRPLLTRAGDTTTTTTKSPGAWTMMKHAHATEGVSVFFRGLGVCSIRAFIVNAVQWSVYELAMRTFQQW